MAMTDEERRERKAQWQRDYARRNLEKIKETRRRRKDKQKEYTRAWRERNPEKVRARKRRWKAENRERVNAYERRRTTDRRNRIAYLEANGLRARLHKQDIYAAANAAVPRHLSRDLRDDAISEIILAVYEGTLDPADIERCARKFVSVQMRGLYEFRDLDGVIPGTENLRLRDVIPADAPHV